MRIKTPPIAPPTAPPIVAPGWDLCDDVDSPAAAGIGWEEVELEDAWVPVGFWVPVGIWGAVAVDWVE